MRNFLIGLSIVCVVAAAIFAMGPRTPADTTVTFDPNSIGTDPVAYLAASEAKVPGIRAGQAKEIIWANPNHSKTPLAIVYVHGFSASSGEIRPVPEMVAKELGANLYFTRLTGHGQDGPAMAKGSINAWVNDYAEALAIGRLIGERVVVISTSTGGSLAVSQALNANISNHLAGLVLISPNFGVQAGGAFLLTWPWGGQIAELVAGAERSFEPHNARQAELWTTRYPTSAVLPMARLVQLAVETPVENITLPALFIYSKGDTVVRPELTDQIAQRWGGPKKVHFEAASTDPSQHVIAGDTLSPETTTPTAKLITDWIRSF